MELVLLRIRIEARQNENWHGRYSACQLKENIISHLTHAFDELLGLGRHALPIKPVKRAGAAFKMMNDIRVPAKRNSLLADKFMMEHAIRAIANDLRHVQIVHCRLFLSLR